MKEKRTSRIGWRKVLLAIPVLLLVLAGVSYFLLNSWLNSAGGRDAIAAELSKRSGLPVRLEGDFDVMLWPAIGVSGSTLKVGLQDNDLFISGGNYAVSIALRPLFDKRLVIENVSLENGEIYPDRYQAKSTGGQGGVVTLPDIDRLQVENFNMVLPGGDGQSLLIRELTLDKFTSGQATPFFIGVDGIGQLQGSVSWNAHDQQVALQAAGEILEYGAIEIDSEYLLDSMHGSLWLSLVPPAQQQTIELGFQFRYRDQAVFVKQLLLHMPGQSVAGDGCLLLADAPSLNLELTSEFLNLDSLLEMAPKNAGNGLGGNSEMPLEINLRFTAKELRGQGAVAHEAVLYIGEPPDCGNSNRASAG